MITAKLVGRLCTPKVKKHKCKILCSFIFGTVVLVIVGHYLECSKLVEFGGMWTFEQVCGTVKDILSAAEEVESKV